MKLVALTAVGASKSAVYINPDQVVVVNPLPKYTAILTAARGGDGQGFWVNVQEKAEDVVRALEKG